MLKFTIVGTVECTFCQKAQALLTKEGYEFDYITLDNKPELKDFVKTIGFSTVPIVFVRKTEPGYPTLIGTYMDLVSFLAFRKNLAYSHTINHQGATDIDPTR